MMPRITRKDNLRPTLESTALKLMEESGEFARVVSKFRGMSGEDPKAESYIVAELENELMDVQQVAATLEYVLDIDIEKSREEHFHKMLKKGYMKPFSENANKC